MQKLRLGLTLIEFLVVLGIVSILGGLTMVTMQHARESARRVVCENHLHQLGIAVTHYVDTRKVYPKLFGNRGFSSSTAFEQTPFVAILPELESPLPKLDPYTPSDVSGKYPPMVLRCPSSNDFLGYRFNAGSGINWRTDLNGILRVFDELTPSMIDDGLSSTAMISERLSGNERRKPIAMASFPKYFTADKFVSDCEHLTIPSSLIDDVGLEWQKHQPRDLAYGHFAAPNSANWDCQGRYHHLISARSNHSGGVFTVYVDGSVHWIQDNIDRQTWYALGTVSGHEVLTGETNLP